MDERTTNVELAQLADDPSRKVAGAAGRLEWGLSQRKDAADSGIVTGVPRLEVACAGANVFVWPFAT